jgi:plasmid stabilization system protein ParE
MPTKRYRSAAMAAFAKLRENKKSGAGRSGIYKRRRLRRSWRRWSGGILERDDDALTEYRQCRLDLFGLRDVFRVEHAPATVSLTPSR